MRTRLLSLCLALLLLLSGFCLPTVAESGTVEVYITLGDGLADEAASSSDPAAYLQTPGGGAAYASLTAELDASEAQLRTLVPGIEIIGRNWYLSAGLAVRLPAAELTALGRFAAARNGAVGLAQIGYRAFPAETAAEAADTVSAEYAPALVGADALHAEGMRGAGALVAVIDSGYDLAHPAFAAHEGVGIVLDRARLVETFPLLNLSQSMPEQVSAEVLYISDKIPMAYDYADSDFVVTSAQSHGTHVASIIGGGSDAGGAVVGIAPDAQLMLLKTFSDKNTAAASEYAIYCAVEDALLLGADVINLSLGSPPGFPYRTSSFSIDSFIVKARELGCAVVCAVGNEGRVGAGSYYDTTADIDLPLAANPDYGMTAEPASFPSATAVGAFMPDRIWAPSLSANGFAFSYDDSSEGQGFGEMDFIRCLNGQTLPLLTVPGLGAAADYAGLDVTGKLVLVERGTITFTEKLQAAADAGAVGMICYDNVDGDPFSMAFDAMPIPAVFIRRTDGLRLAAMADADRRVTVSLAQASGSVPADAGQPAYYSSRGSGLMIRPEVVAPGTVFAAMPGGRYGSKSGSSMATPIVSGLLALAAAADRDSSSPAEQLNTRLADLITTAEPLLDADGLPYSVRRQGGGSVDAAALFSTDLALRADGRGLLELGDGLGSSFAMTVSLTNRTDAPMSLTLSATVASDDYVLHGEGEDETVFAADTIRTFDRAAILWEDKPVNRAAGQSAALTLAAGETVELTLTVTLSDEDAADYAARFANGYYLEGFVFIECESGKTLSLPYLGFSDDFSALPGVDVFDYDGAQSFFGGQYIYSTVAGETVALGAHGEGDDARYYADLIAFSPNGDGDADSIDFRFRLLRNLHSMDGYVTDAAGEKVWSLSRSFYLPKTYLTADGVLATGNGTLWGGTDNGQAEFILPDGSYTAHLQVLDRTAAVVEEITLPIVLDTEAPRLTEYKISEANGRRYLTLFLADDHYPRTATLYRTETDRYGRVNDLYRDEHAISYQPGRRSIGLRYDITDFAGDYLYLDVDDYACNRTTYKLVLD